MGESFTAAVTALERASDSPGAWAVPFVTAFPVSGASVSTLGELLGSETVAATDHLAARLDEKQFDLGEGPCWDAMRRGRPVLEPDFRRAAGAWPAFAAAIRDDPLSSLFAFPVLVGPLRIGAVDLYSVRPARLDAAQAVQAGALAGIVGRQLLRHALREAGLEDEVPANAFSRRVIHQATGMVLAQLDVPADDAHLIIQGHAFADSRPVLDVAQDIVRGTLGFRRGSEGIEVSG